MGSSDKQKENERVGGRGASLAELPLQLSRYATAPGINEIQYQLDEAMQDTYYYAFLECNRAWIEFLVILRDTLIEIIFKKKD